MKNKNFIIYTILLIMLFANYSFGEDFKFEAAEIKILNKGNIVNLEIIRRSKEHLTFSFDLQIKDLKNFTNLISQIKQSNLRFKIIRHKQKKNAFIRRIFENFKRN